MKGAEEREGGKREGDKQEAVFSFPFLSFGVSEKLLLAELVLHSTVVVESRGKFSGVV